MTYRTKIMKATTLIFALLLPLLGIAHGGELETTEYKGQVEMLAVDGDHIRFDCEAGKARFLMVGFASEPVILDLADDPDDRSRMASSLAEACSRDGASVRWPTREH